MAQINKLISQRDLITFRINRLKLTLDNILCQDQIEENDLIELQNSVEDQAVINALTEYEENHLKIINTVEDNASHWSAFEAFDKMFHETKSKIKQILANKGDIKRMSRGVNNEHISSDLELSALPNMKLPTFNGEFSNWVEFRDAFVSLIHDNKKLHDIQKFHYLTTCLEGKAAQALKQLKKTAENYSIAWDLLKRRYENKKLIVQSNISNLFNLESCSKETYTNMKIF